MLDIKLLGRFQISRDGTPIAGLTSAAPQALLAYLVENPNQTVQRRALAGLLWPDQTEATALSRLRSVLFQLRRTLKKDIPQIAESSPTDCLYTARHTLKFVPADCCVVDVLRFQELTGTIRPGYLATPELSPDAVNRLSTAAELYSGEFLQGFSSESALFEEWMVIQRESYHLKMLAALDLLAQHYECKGAYVKTLRYARWQIALEPWCERAHRQAMRALTLSDQRATAIAQFETCRAVLADELSIEPEPQTCELHMRIRRGDLQPHRAVGTNAQISPETSVAVRDRDQTPPMATTSQAAGDIAPSEPTDDGERRRVTILRADVITPPETQTETELWAEMVTPVLQALTTAAKDLDGHIVQLGSDGIIAVFGTTVAHEDDPERAILAALEMKRSVASTLEEPGAACLGIRITVQRGDAIIRNVGGSLSVISPVMNIAKRIQKAIAPNSLWVSEDVQQLTPRTFEWHVLPAIVVEGIEQPVIGYRPIRPLRLTDKGRGLADDPAPLVGRHAELVILKKAISQVRGGVGGIITLIGEAGIGKSRLVAEARQETSRMESGDLVWVEGRCLSYATHTSYQVWVDLLHELIGISPRADTEAVKDKLREKVHRFCPQQAEDVTPFLAWLMALPPDRDSETRVSGTDSQGLQILTHRAIEILLSAVARRTPLVIALEDMHWADQASLTLLNHLLPLVDRVPLLLICIHRPAATPESRQLRETITSTYPHRHTAVRLAPLNESESAELVEHLLPFVGFPHAPQASVIDRSGGNPFYIEEILRSLANTEAIAQGRENGNRYPTRNVTDLVIPDTLQGILAGRIDQLPRQAKHVLQLASVIGRIFPHRLLDAVAEKGNIDDTLILLQRAGMIRQRVAPPNGTPKLKRKTERTFIFKHQLTLEATYNGLLRRRRRILHRRIAEAIVRLYGDQIDSHLSLLAYHWEAAEEQGQAIHFLRLAAQQATARYANAEAVDYLNRALDLLPEGDLEHRYDIILNRESIYNICGDRELQMRDLEELKSLAETLTEDPARRAGRRAQVALREADCWFRLADPSRAMAAAKHAVDFARLAHDVSAEARAYLYWGRDTPPGELRTQRLARALSLAKQTQAHTVAADALRQIGINALEHGQWEVARTRLLESLNLYHSIEDGMGEGRTLNALAMVKWHEGDTEGVRGHLQEGLHLCHQTGNRWEEMWASGMMGFLCESCGSYADARPHYERAIDLAHQVGYQRGEISTRALLGTIHAKLGDLEAAGACFRDATSLQLDSDAAVAIANLGTLAHCLGNDQAALAYCQQAFDIDPVTAMDREVVLLAYGDVLAAVGRYAEATEIFQEAIVVHAQVGWIRMSMEAEAGLARVLLAQGKLTQALRQVEDILAYRETTHPTFEGARDIYTIFLTCYRVLVAAGDPRAAEVIEAGHTFLQERAAAIGDESLRQTFLENVPSHRAIVAMLQEHRRTDTGT